MAYTTEQLETISRKLGELPRIERRKRQHNKKEAVKLLKRDIDSLRARGYTLGQIAEVFRRLGLDITERTLRNYLQQLKRPVKKTPAIQKSAPQNTDATEAETSGETGFDNNEIEGKI